MTKKSGSKKEAYNLLMYVEDSFPKLKKFTNMKEMEKFVKAFQKKYPDTMAIDSGNWIDYVITEVSGEVHFFTDGISLE